MHTRSFHGNDLRERAFRRLRRAEAENTPALGAGRDSIAAINEQVDSAKTNFQLDLTLHFIFWLRQKLCPPCSFALWVRDNIREPSPYVYS